MKVFFVFILLINIVFFLWEFNNPPASTSLVNENPKIEQIVLLSEFQEKERILAQVESELEQIEQLDNISDLNHTVMNDVIDDIDRTSFFNIDSTVKKETKKIDKSFTANSGINGSNIESDNLELDVLGEFFKSLKKPASETQSIDSPDPKNSAMSSLQDKAIKKPVLLNKQRGSGRSKVSAPENKKFCYQISPFDSLEELNKWVDINKIEKDSVTSFSQEVQVLSNYLVYYPAAKTYTLSKNNVEMLKRKGIDNYWMFRKGELKGAYSLGLFVKEKRALFLQKKLAEDKLNVEIMPRYKEKEVWTAKLLSKTELSKETITLSEEQTLSLCKNIE